VIQGYRESNADRHEEGKAAQKGKELVIQPG